MKNISSYTSTISISHCYDRRIDETTDISNNEQTTVVFRHGTEDLEVFEEFMGLYHVPSIDAETLTSVIKDSNYVEFAFSQASWPVL